MVPYSRRRRAEAVLQAAGVDATWSGPPSAEEIRKGDTDRMLNDPLLTEETPEEDLVLARVLLEGRSAEDIAAALIRLYRAKLPAPEELFDGGAYLREPREKNSRERRLANTDGPKQDWTRPQREAREGASDGVWFRLNIGREKNADPKWLIPLICRRGHVTKKDIGEIRIFDRETKFEIAPGAEARFREAVRTAAEGDVPITAAGGPPAPRTAGPRPSGPPAARPSGPRGPGPKGGYKGAAPRGPGGPRPPAGKGAPPRKGPPKRKPNG
jgi:ATP-dependent RNA helicase DeaD